MRAFHFTRIGRRLPGGLVFLALSAVCGLLFWKTREAELALLALGLAIGAVLFPLLGWNGLLWPFCLFEDFDSALPIIVGLALLCALGVLLQTRLRRNRETVRQFIGAMPEALRPILVRFPNGRRYQLLRAPGEIRAYRVGGLRGVDPSLLQTPGAYLRQPVAADLRFPSDVSAVLTKTRNPFRRPGLIAHVRVGRRVYRMRAAMMPEPVDLSNFRRSRKERKSGESGRQLEAYWDSACAALLLAEKEDDRLSRFLRQNIRSCDDKTGRLE